MHDGPILRGFVFFNHDCVANCQHGVEVPQCLPLLRIGYEHLTGNILDRLWERTECLALTLPVDDTVHRALLEYHLVLCQSTGLVAENEVDLPQLFDQIGCPAQCELFGLRIIHFGIIADQVALAQLEHLDYDVKGDGYQMRVGDLEGQEVKEGRESSDPSL